MADAITTTRGYNVPTSDDVKELNDLLDQVKQKMQDMGADPGTADALIQAARPPEMTIVGNLADLQRMGSIAVNQEIPTAPTETNIESTDINDAFKLTDQQEEQQRINEAELFGETRTLATSVVNEGTPGTGEPAQSDVSDSMTKADLLNTAMERGVSANDGMTKQEIIDAINKG